MIGLLFVSTYCDILSTQSSMQMEAFPKTKKAGRFVVLQREKKTSMEALEAESQPLSNIKN